MNWFNFIRIGSQILGLEPSHCGPVEGVGEFINPNRVVMFGISLVPDAIIAVLPDDSVAFPSLQLTTPGYLVGGVGLAAS